ncbi:MAG: hypothetical protein WDZ40_03595 [Candidatus Spechtbacterales bacterium]
MDESFPKKEAEVNPKEREPSLEIERKYLLASEEDLEKLEDKIVSLFPNTKMIGEYHEDSRFYESMNKEQALEFAEKLNFDYMAGVDSLIKQLTHLPDDIRIQLRLRGRLDENNIIQSIELTFKASENPLHDVERVEINVVVDGDYVYECSKALYKLGPKETSIWTSRRKLYKIDADTQIDIQNVTGYGYTAEIESNSVEKVEEIERQLGLNPVSSNLLNVMYKKYSENTNWLHYYRREGDERHFSEEDWQEIESEAKEKVVRNKLE